MPCQLMVGFFAYAKTFEINVDMEELEGTHGQLFSIFQLGAFLFSYVKGKKGNVVPWCLHCHLFA